MSEIEKFNKQKDLNIKAITANRELQELGVKFIEEAGSLGYSYNFTWMGRPIIAFPQDMIAMQELIWSIKPDLIIETGVAHGGSIIYYASLLELIGSKGMVLGIDIDIREHNRTEIESHPMFKRIKLIEGSSIDENTFAKVKGIANDYNNILVCLDSNHTHDHVYKELELYSSLVTKNSYCVVFDTVIENMPDSYDWKGRPWSKGNNPKTAVDAFLRVNRDFRLDNEVDGKLIISVAKGGFLKRV